MAFRILRLNRYPVSPNVFDRFTEDRFWNDTMEGYLKDEGAVLELYKASNVILPEEGILQHQQSWTKQFLLDLLKDHQEDSSAHHLNKSLLTQIDNVLTHPFRGSFEPVTYKRNIEQYSTDTTRLLKSSYPLSLENKLDDLRLAKMKTGFCYFTALATFLEPELFEARSLFTKHSILVSLVDDLFDMFGTPEEHLNLVHLIEIRWNPRGPTVEFASERVETLYWALHHTINETVELAYHTTKAVVLCYESRCSTLARYVAKNVERNKMVYNSFDIG
ncbi:Ent-kaur-16-ene synthase, chloroplastic [Linum grandiflorum]